MSLLRLLTATVNALTLAACISLPVHAQQGQAAGEPNGAPKGSLNQPLGDYLTIEGITPDQDFKVGSFLWVSMVNGKALSEKVGIPIDGFDSSAFPRRTRCVLKGYETGRMVGQPPAVVAAAREAGQPAPPGPPVPWHFAHRFVVLKVVSPDQPRDAQRKD
jgi:hypothetical protein